MSRWYQWIGALDINIKNNVKTLLRITTTTKYVSCNGLCLGAIELWTCRLHCDATFRISLLSPKRRQHSLHNSEPGSTLTARNHEVFYTMSLATLTTSSHVNAFWFSFCLFNDVLTATTKSNNKWFIRKSLCSRLGIILAFSRKTLREPAIRNEFSRMTSRTFNHVHILQQTVKVYTYFTVRK